MAAAVPRPEAPSPIRRAPLAVGTNAAIAVAVVGSHGSITGGFSRRHRDHGPREGSLADTGITGHGRVLSALLATQPSNLVALDLSGGGSSGSAAVPDAVDAALLARRIRVQL